MLKVYGMIAFQFDIHPMLMTIEVDMQKKRKIGNAVCYAIAGNLFSVEFDYRPSIITFEHLISIDFY